MIWVDWISIYFIGSVLVIRRRVVLFSFYYIKNTYHYTRFVLLVIIFVFSIILLIIRPRVFSIILGWDGLGMSSLFLVIYYQNRKALNAGVLTLLINRLGDVAILIAIMSLIVWGDFSIIFISLEKFFMVTFFLLIAARTKRALIPFSAWLPAAMAAPTPVSALVHSSTLVTAGVYILVRFSPLIKVRNLEFVILYLGLLTIIIAGIAALYTNDIKKMVAFSTLSQLGLIAIILGAGAPLLTFYHLLLHAYFKALLFIVVGYVMHLRGDYQELKYVNSHRLWSLSLLRLSLLSNLSLIGVPFISGYYSKDLVLELL